MPAEQQTSNGKLFCELLYSALKREEDEIREIGTAKGKPEHFLLSVAFAPELAIKYLVRKEALRRGVAIEWGYKQVDLCLVGDDGNYTASLEVKVWGMWTRKRDPLRKDVRKVLNQSIPNIAPGERYNAWILVLEDTTTDALEVVRSTLKEEVEVVESFVSAQIPINQTGDAPSVVKGHKHECLQVVVFNSRSVGIAAIA